MQRLEMTIEETKDSKQAADMKLQQTLDQHKVISQYLYATHMCMYSTITYVCMHVMHLFELYVPKCLLSPICKQWFAIKKDMTLNYT